MKKSLKIGALFFAVVVLFLVAMAGIGSSSAWFSVQIPITGNEIRSASFSFNMNGVDSADPLQIDLGTIIPGQSGRADVTITNTGSRSAKFSVTIEAIPSGLVISNSDTSDVTIEPNSSTVFSVDWVLPAEVHDTGLDGTDFQFSYSILFENGYTVTKQVIIKGRIVDLADTPTAMDTATVTDTLVPTDIPTDTLVPPTATEIVTDTPVPTDIPTDTLVPPTATEIVTDTPVPTDIPTDIPTEVP